MLTALSASLVLCQRELVRFLRQRNRVIGALLTPVVFWLLIGGGMGRSFTGVGATTKAAQAGYLTYFFPGTVLMILLFTAIFSTISVIEDRREGFLQGVLVAPVGRSAIVGGKVLGGAILGTGQAGLFLLLGWATGVVSMAPLHWLATLLVLFVAAIGLTALALAFAWPMTSTQGFHVVMNLFFVPLWFLSGALFPVRDDTPLVLKGLMLANPMSYALASLRYVMRREWSGALPGWPQLWFLVTVLAAATTVGLALLVARSRSNADAV